jgi:hypothetical protein
VPERRIDEQRGTAVDAEAVRALFAVTLRAHRADQRALATADRAVVDHVEVSA